MTNQSLWFLEERARAFVSLLLTKNPEVALHPHAGREEELDFLVEVRRDDKSTLRFFGVQLVPFLDLPNPSTVDEEFSSNRDRQLRDVGLPLAIFVIGVRQPEGIYRWLVEPVVEEGHALLRYSESGAWQSLDEGAIARLIERVSTWYEALNGNSSTKALGRHAKKESR